MARGWHVAASFSTMLLTAALLAGCADPDDDAPTSAVESPAQDEPEAPSARGTDPPVRPTDGEVLIGVRERVRVTHAVDAPGRVARCALALG